MKITQLIGTIAFSWLLWGCASNKRETQAAPAASPPQADVSTEAAEPLAAPGAVAPTEAPPPAPAPAAPQGLDRRKEAESKTTVRDDEPQFTTVEAAERALAHAKADLDRLALAEPQASRATTGPAKKDSARAGSASAAAEANATAPNNQCDGACRALASMSRAASAVCRLDGESGSHCTRAKQVVSDSQRRVSSCVCHATGE